MTWLWSVIRERPRLSLPTEPSRNGWLFLMNPFSVKAHWIVSVIVLISSSLMASLIGNEPRLQENRKVKIREPGFPQGMTRDLPEPKVTRMSAESHCEKTRTKHFGLWAPVETAATEEKSKTLRCFFLS